MKVSTTTQARAHKLQTKKGLEFRVEGFFGFLFVLWKLLRETKLASAHKIPSKKVGLEIRVDELFASLVLWNLLRD